MPGALDQVDLAFTVVENPTGNLLVGAGPFRPAVLPGPIPQENVFGSGNYLGVDNTDGAPAACSRSAPWTPTSRSTASTVHRGLLPHQQADQPAGRPFEFVTQGGALRFGHSTEDDTVFFGIGYEQTKITTTRGLPNNNNYRQQFGESDNSVPLTIGWSRDTRDSVITPNQGQLQARQRRAVAAG